MEDGEYIGETRRCGNAVNEDQHAQRGPGGPPVGLQRTDAANHRGKIRRLVRHKVESILVSARNWDRRGVGGQQRTLSLLSPTSARARSGPGCADTTCGPRRCSSPRPGAVGLPFAFGLGEEGLARDSALAHGGGNLLPTGRPVAEGLRGSPKASHQVPSVTGCSPRGASSRMLSALINASGSLYARVYIGRSAYRR